MRSYDSRVRSRLAPSSSPPGHSHPLAQICGSTHALPPSALPHYNHLADSNDDTGGSLIVNEQYSSTILNQLHTASSILLDDRCSVLLFDLHAPSLRRAVLSIFSRCVRSADVARLAVAAGVSCDAHSHQRRAALQPDSRTDRGVFSLPSTFPSTPSLFIRLFLFSAISPHL